MSFNADCINLVPAQIVNSFDQEKIYGVFGNTEGRIIGSRIENAGSAVVCFPKHDCEKIDLADGDLESLRNLHAFDWVIFTDIFSARYFVEALADIATDLNKLRICSAGESVVHYLRVFRIHSDLILTPHNHAAEEIAEFAGVELNSLRFLIPSDSAAENSAALEFQSRGAYVRELPLYRTKTVGNDDLSRIKALMLGGAIDELMFSNLDDVLSLQFLFPDEGLCELLKEVVVNAAAEDVYQYLIEYGLHPRYI